MTGLLFKGESKSSSFISDHFINFKTLSMPKEKQKTTLGVFPLDL